MYVHLENETFVMYFKIVYVLGYNTTVVTIILYTICIMRQFQTTIFCNALK